MSEGVWITTTCYNEAKQLSPFIKGLNFSLCIYTLIKMANPIKLFKLLSIVISTPYWVENQWDLTWVCPRCAAWSESNNIQILSQEHQSDTFPPLPVPNTISDSLFSLLSATIHQGITWNQAGPNVWAHHHFYTCGQNTHTHTHTKNYLQLHPYLRWPSYIKNEGQKNSQWKQLSLVNVGLCSWCSTE